MEWWLASAKTSGLSREQLAWWDEHGIDEQRGFQIACLLYGSDPGVHGPARRADLACPPNVANRAPGAQENAASWSAFLRG
ncbi:MAG: hypothetical protein IPP28_00155 [Xanthomonadales bacterium]|nr:hypothetical protein [Xanthomonadales bacterium]